MQWLEAREEQERFLREAEEAKQKADADLLQAAVRRFLSRLARRPWEALAEQRKAAEEAEEAKLKARLMNRSCTCSFKVLRAPTRPSYLYVSYR